MGFIDKVRDVLPFLGENKKEINSKLNYMIKKRVAAIDLELSSIRAQRNRLMGAHSLRNQYSVLQSHVLHYNEYISLIPRIKLLLSEIMQVLELIKDNNTSLDIDENTITRLNTAKIELGRDIDSVEGKKNIKQAA